ncbi:MAG: transporter substrate-binding domain-containing protein [Staphylococcus sp.]|nr:transporter substrate-binding domain-containing protein [Staphylococcus sp.]
MKRNFKFIYIFVILFSMLLMVGCIDDSSKKVSVIVPTGTPSLGIANVLNDKTLVDANIVSGSDPLIAAFTNASYDVVVAPVNLGAKLYNSNENFSYILYKTIVWGNYYLVSNEEIATLENLEGKTVLVFGMNSTPDVVLRTLISAKNINVNLEYVDDVTTANSYLLSGKADIIVSAEPSLTKISANKNFYILDLQKQWQQLTGRYSLPQAGIFIKKNIKDEKYLKSVLDKMIESVQMASTKPNVLVANAINVDENLAKIGEETLQKAIGNCNLRVEETDKEAIEFYFSQVIQLGIGATVGGKLPDEGFYY